MLTTPAQWNATINTDPQLRAEKTASGVSGSLKTSCLIDLAGDEQVAQVLPAAHYSGSTL
jgi:hypothetical protein